MQVNDIYDEVKEMTDREKKLLLAKILGAFASKDEMNILEVKTKEVIKDSFQSIKRTRRNHATNIE